MVVNQVLISPLGSVRSVSLRVPDDPFNSIFTKMRDGLYLLLRVPGSSPTVGRLRVDPFFDRNHCSKSRT